MRQCVIRMFLSRLNLTISGWRLRSSSNLRSLPCLCLPVGFCLPVSQFLSVCRLMSICRFLSVRRFLSVGYIFCLFLSVCCFLSVCFCLLVSVCMSISQSLPWSLYLFSYTQSILIIYLTGISIQ